MLSVIMLSVIMPSVIMPSVVMLIVAAPSFHPRLASIPLSRETF